MEGFWNWTYVENTGVAFGFLQGHNEILALLVLAILGLSFWIAREFDWNQKSTQIVGSMIAGGAIGNLIDRFQHGYVIDFVDWHYRGWHWPAFNIADSLICISMVLMIVSQFSNRQSAPEPDPDSHPNQ